MASRLAAASGVAALCATLIGCSAIDVSNPTEVSIDDMANSVGADYTIPAVRQYFGYAIASSVTSGGIMTDEFFVHTNNTLSSLDAKGALDRREGILYENIANGIGAYANWQTAWRYASISLSFVQQYGQATTRDVQLSELFSLRGYVMLGLAEEICPGFPVREMDAHDLHAIRPVYTSAPQTTDSAFLRAAAQFDSALAHAGDSARVLNLARVGKARALLGLGRFTDAAAVATAVPAGYTGGMVAENIRRRFRSEGVAVGDAEGTNGQPFVTSGDPRISLTQVNDFVDGLPATWYAPADYYANRYPTVTIASDVEARLIEAESQLQPATSPSGPWLETLNTLRRNAGMSDLTDPATGPERIDLLFRERAFWLFGTGHRLGDLRRLISRYGRSAEAVFPTGAYWRPGNYGTATSIPFDGAIEHLYNGAITGCLAR